MAGDSHSISKPDDRLPPGTLLHTLGRTTLIEARCCKQMVVVAVQSQRYVLLCMLLAMVVAGYCWLISTRLIFVRSSFLLN